ncbi:MAG: hypothetical protein KJ000_09220 [Pirellulaceae bacterium]|nr:hypothetical protein [Pirellulaceae bacterium]
MAKTPIDLHPWFLACSNGTVKFAEPTTEIEEPTAACAAEEANRSVGNRSDNNRGIVRTEADRAHRKTLAGNAGVFGCRRRARVHFQNGLEARLSEDAELWRRSGLADVDRHLVEFLAGEKSQALGCAPPHGCAENFADRGGFGLHRCVRDNRLCRFPLSVFGSHPINVVDDVDARVRHFGRMHVLDRIQQRCGIALLNQFEQFRSNDPIDHGRLLWVQRRERPETDRIKIRSAVARRAPRNRHSAGNRSPANDFTQATSSRGPSSPPLMRGSRVLHHVQLIGENSECWFS